jgi:glycosyltransferase involved in cell wall biosynthesis
MSESLVSIIIPNYNRADLLPQTLDSISDQSFPWWEAIIVDDGSTDNSLEVIRSYVEKDSRFRLFLREKENKGPQVCRNIGLSKSTGEFLIFLDSDDLLVKDCLRNRVEKMRQYPELDFAVFPMQHFRYKVGDLNRIWLRKSMENYLSAFLLRTQWPITGPIWKSKSFISLGGWDESVIVWQDWDIHVRALSSNLKFKVFEGKPDCYYRTAGNVRLMSAYKKKELYLNRVVLCGKLTRMLREKGLLTDINKQLMAAHYLTLAGEFRRIGETSYAEVVWQEALDLGLVNARYFKRGKTYIKIESLFPRKWKLIKKTIKAFFVLLIPKKILSH